MTKRKKIRSDGIAIFLLAATVTAPSATNSLTITCRLSSPNTQVVKNIGIHSSRNKGNTRNALTAIYSENKDMQTDEFKDIDIDDVLLEADNALKAAQTSLVEDDVNKKSQEFQKIDFKDIDVDDVLLEAESALKAAQTSLVDDDANKKNGDDELEIFKEAIRYSLLSDDMEDKASITVTEILSSTIGGILLGSLLGSIAAFKLSEFGDSSFATQNFDAADFPMNALEISIPIIVGVSLGGITGFAGSLQDDVTGTVVRNVLGVPVKALASAIVNNIQQAARRQVEKTTNNIKAIPSNVANSAKQKATQTAKEAKLVVEIALEKAIESALEKVKKLLLILAVLSSFIVLGVLITNVQLIETSSQQF